MEDETTSRNRRRRASTTLEEESVTSDAPDRKRPRRSSRADSVAAASVSSTPSRSSSRIAASKNRRAPPLPHTVSLSVIDGSDGEDGDNDDDELVPPAPTMTSTKKAKKTKEPPKKKKESPKAQEVVTEETRTSPTPKSTLESPSKTEDTSSTISTPTKPAVKSKVALLLKIAAILVLAGNVVAFFPRLPSVRSFHHIIPPQHVLDSVRNSNDKQVKDNPNQYQYQHHTDMYLTNTTLREFLMDPEGFHLAMAVRTYQKNNLLCPNGTRFLAVPYPAMSSWYQGKYEGHLCSRFFVKETLLHSLFSLIGSTQHFLLFHFVFFSSNFQYICTHTK